MKKYFPLSVIASLGLVVSVLALPAVTLAAGNDVTLTTSAVLSVGGYMLNVTGSSGTVQSIVVNPTNFVVTLASGSSLQVTSPTYNQLTTDTSTFTTSNTCITNNSVLTLASTGGTGSVTVTPTATLCSTPVSSGGNGPVVGSTASGAGVVHTVTPTPITTTSPTSPNASIQAQIAALTDQLNAILAANNVSGSADQNTSSGFRFNQDLKFGMTSSDVLILQQYLNAHSFVIATSGVGSSGHESAHFGALTQKALKALQKSLGLPATGFFGPMTRAKLNQ